jgi:hypothetical protein
MLENKPAPLVVSTSEWQDLARQIIHSPRSPRHLSCETKDVRAAFQSKYPVETLLTGTGLRWWTATAVRAFATDLRLRQGSARVGFHQFPAASAVARLLELAASELSQVDSAQRVGLAGLTFLVVHPFEDGNGRSARFIWLKGLMNLGISPAESIMRLQEFYGIGGIAALPTFQAASYGTVEPFVSRWEAVMRS